MKPIFEQLASNPWYYRIIEMLEANHGSPLSENMKKSLIDRAYWSDVIPKQAFNWVDRTIHLVDKILKGKAEDSDFDMFWIQLWGLLKEAGPYFSKGEEFIRDMPDSEKKRAINTLLELGKQINLIKSVLSESELVTITYMRHCRCHVHQNAYRVKVSLDKPEVIKEEFPEHLLDIKVSVDDFLVMITEVFNQITPAESRTIGLDNSVAKRICQKIEGQLKAVKNARENCG